MTITEREQAKALKACVVDDVEDRELRFITDMDHRARTDINYWMSPAQISYMRALAWKYREELMAAGKWKLFLVKPKGAKQ